MNGAFFGGHVIAQRIYILKLIQTPFVEGLKSMGKLNLSLPHDHSWISRPTKCQFTNGAFNNYEQHPPKQLVAVLRFLTHMILIPSQNNGPEQPGCGSHQTLSA